MKYYIEITIDEKNQNFFEILARLFYLTHLGFVEVAKQSENPNKSKIAIAFPEYQYTENSATKKGFGIIGTKLRLFSQSREDLEKFNANSRFLAITDYIKITEILEVPASKVTSFAVFMRHQEKTNLAKISKRYLQREEKLLDIINNSQDSTEVNNARQKLTARQNRRQNLDIHQFINSEDYNKKELSKIDLPFINVVSNDKKPNSDFNKKQKNYFKLWVKKINVDKEFLGDFNSYGLSQNSSDKASYHNLEDIRKLATIPEF